VTPVKRGKGNKANAKGCFGSLTLLPSYNGDRPQLAESSDTWR
jgi:hypothetical protein